mmetsp:Transcript_22197/g.51652  ORF Transcript_22197/g.51652 Transcript_22197/m.51652 type:complete len:253 (+) Transcript_22197:943-1701(+)
MEEERQASLEQAHSARPFGSYFLASGGNCSHCMPLVAPGLFANAVRIESGHYSQKIMKQSGFGDAVGAVADMRALARCAIAIIDDKAAGTFALAFAAAGRLTPCADPLAWLETTGPGFGTMHPSIAGKLRLAVPGHPRVNLRALCRTSNPKAPVIPVPLLRPDELLRLADSVRFDVSRPWHPILIVPAPFERLGIARTDGENATGFLSPGCDEAYLGTTRTKKRIIQRKKLKREHGGGTPTLSQEIDTRTSQ